jgi:plastocyanin
MTTAPTAAHRSPSAARAAIAPRAAHPAHGRRRRLLPVLGALGLAAACGGTCAVGTSASQTTTVTPSFTLTGTDNKFDGSSYKVGPTFAIEYRNRGSVTHSLVVKDSSGKILTNRVLLAPGKVAGFQATLPAGAYKLVCDVPGHEGTMRADLTVA